MTENDPEYHSNARAGGQTGTCEEERQDHLQSALHFSTTSTETMSDKIKRMLKNEVQQM